MTVQRLLAAACGAACLGTAGALSPRWAIASSPRVTANFLGSRSMLVRGGGSPQAGGVCMTAGDNDLYIVGAGYLG